MQDSQKVHGKCMIWKILGMDFKVFIHQIKLVFWSVPIKSQDKNFCLRIPFFTLISWVWLSIGTLALRYMCETRKPPFAYYSPGGHPAAKCQLNRGESRGLQSKGSRMANCHQFLQQVWHLGILASCCSLPSPRLTLRTSAWNAAYPTNFSCFPLSLCDSNTLSSYTLVVKWGLYLWDHPRSNVIVSRLPVPHPLIPMGKDRIATSPLDLIARQHSAMWICHFCLAQISISPPTVTTLLDIF